MDLAFSPAPGVGLPGTGDGLSLHVHPIDGALVKAPGTPEELQPAADHPRSAGKIQNPSGRQRRLYQSPQQHFCTGIQLTLAEDAGQAGDLQVDTLAGDPGPALPVRQIKTRQWLMTDPAPHLTVPSTINLEGLL